MDKLTSILSSDTVPHILFYGSEDRGLVDFLLKNIYGSQNDYCMFIECATCKGIKVIRDDIKEFAKQQISNQVCFKSIILYDAENLTIDAQYSLRRCIEIYSKTTRFFILTENKDKLISPICSRFIHIYNKPIETEYKKIKWTQNMKSWLKGEDLFEIAEKIYKKGIYGDQLLEYYRNDSNEFIEFEFEYENMCRQLKNETWILFMILKHFKKPAVSSEASA
jgi:DNA polymerase III delta prime subunit